jgi:hypothetical protein
MKSSRTQSQPHQAIKPTALKVRPSSPSSPGTWRGRDQLLARAVLQQDLEGALSPGRQLKVMNLLAKLPWLPLGHVFFLSRIQSLRHAYSGDWARAL